MGDAADDVFDAGLRAAHDHELMLAAGCKPRPRRHLHNDEECPVCKDMGWIDTNGEPCEI